MSEKRPVRAIAADLLRAALVGVALTMDMNLRSGNNYTNWWASLMQPWIITLIAAGAFFLLRGARRTLPALRGPERLLALFLGAWWVLAQSVRNTNNVLQPFLSSGQTLKAAATALGMAVVYALLLRGLAALLTAEADLPRPAPGGALLRLYREHTQALCAAFLLLCWLPQFCAAYPFCMNRDTSNQLFQALGTAPMVADYPILGTLLLRLFAAVGERLGSAAAGLTLYTLVQIAFAAYAAGYAQLVIRRLGAPRWLCALWLLLMAFGPVYCDNVTVLLKDVPYAWAFLLLLSETARAELLEGDAYRRSAGHLARCWGSCALLMLIRNNGVLVLLPFAALMLLRAAKAGGRARLALAAAALLPPLVLSSAFSAIGARLCGVDRTFCLREALSLPFQQTARYVTLHGDEVPPEEREAIDTLLDFDRLPYRYDPIISDPVKWLCPEDAALSDALPYLRVWAKQFLRDPVTHLQATFITNALLFDPQTYNLAIFEGTGLDDETAEALGAVRPALCEELTEIEDRLHGLLNGMPLYLTLNTLGFYAILLLFAAAIALRRRAWEMLPFFLPLFLTVGIIVCGPCIQNQDRYGFPIVYCMPLVLACLRRSLRQKTAARA